MGLFRMRSGEASEGMRSWMSTAMGPSWFRLVQLPSIIKPLDWLSAGTQEISKPQFSPQHSQRTHPDAHEGTQGWEKMSPTCSLRSWKEGKRSNFRPKPQRNSCEFSCRYNKTCLGEGSCILQPSPLSNAKILFCRDEDKGLTPTLCYPDNTQTPGAEGAAASGQIKLTIFFPRLLN